MTVNTSWRRESAGTATCLVEKWRLLGHPRGACGRATDVRVDPSRAACRALPAGIPGVTVPQRASPPSLLRLGKGSASRKLHSRGCRASAIHLHDALSPVQVESSTMRWRKKLYDALTVRTLQWERGLIACVPQAIWTAQTC